MYATIELSQLKPAKFTEGPSTYPYPPGRLFKFDEGFKKANIDFSTDIHTMSNALAILTSTNTDEQGIHHACSCNGPHHALIVAKFSYMVAGEMLEHDEMKTKIDQIIGKMGPEAQQFLIKDNYQNYKKIIELMALLHDTGRPSDGIDQWDGTNELNVIHNIGYLLKTANLSQEAIGDIMVEVVQGINNKDELELTNDDGFLFGAPLGAGDSLHSGHAFHGGVWDHRSYNPEYVRLYTQYPGFQESFQAIVSEVGKFVPKPTKENGGHLAAVNNYLNWHENKGDGRSIIKSNFANIIHEEFGAIDPLVSPIMGKHFGSKQTLAEQQSASPDVLEQQTIGQYIEQFISNNAPRDWDGTQNKLYGQLLLNALPPVLTALPCTDEAMEKINNALFELRYQGGLSVETPRSQVQSTPAFKNLLAGISILYPVTIEKDALEQPVPPAQTQHINNKNNPWGKRHAEHHNENITDLTDKIQARIDKLNNSWWLTDTEKVKLKALVMLKTDLLKGEYKGFENFLDKHKSPNGSNETIISHNEQNEIKKGEYSHKTKDLFDEADRIISPAPSR